MLPDFVGHISQYSFATVEDTGENALIIHLPNKYASQSILESLDILVYLFFRYCGIESEPAEQFRSRHSFVEVQVNKVGLSQIDFDLYNYTMKWFNVKLSGADDWIPPTIHKHLGKKEDTKGNKAEAAKSESEVHVPGAVPRPLVFPRSPTTVAPPSPTIDDNSSWDQFFSGLDD